MKENERKYLLKEQLKIVQQQLGTESDLKQTYINKVQERIDKMKQDNVPQAAISVGCGVWCCFWSV